MEPDGKKKPKSKKIEDRDARAGMRMGYHSEKARPEPAEPEGGGMRMGYHSEKANPSKHSKRLHKEPK